MTKSVEGFAAASRAAAN